MNVTTDDLREALQAYADEVPLPDAASLVAGARRKRAHARKVRTAVIAGAAAVLMVVATAVGIHGIGNEKALTPAQLNKKFHTHYAEYTRGLKLTNIVEVPVEHADDPNNASAASNAASIGMPKIGSRVYIACDSRRITGKKAANSDGFQQVQLRGSSNLFATCGPGPKPMLSGAKPGYQGKGWLVTDATPAVSKAPIAIYTQVAWDAYPIKARTLNPAPEPLSPQSPNGEHNVVISGNGAGSTSRSVHVPPSMDSWVQLTVVPSTTGRFQVLVDGKVQRFDETAGLPAYMGGGLAPESRGEWIDYWPDSGDGLTLERPPSFKGPQTGHAVTITVRAVDTTGPWKVMLTWQKK